MSLKTPLHDAHIDAGARMVDFGGWQMPLNYGSQKEEHHAVRNAAGMFDVSHMTVVDLSGKSCRDFLRHLLANDVAKLEARGRALYTCMLNESGGVIDDLIVYFLDAANYRVIVNAATRDKDLAWIRTHAEPFGVTVKERPDLAMLALQGPEACERAAPLVAEEFRADALDLLPFSAIEAGDLFIARTGYTGEDGWEILLPGSEAQAFWQRLLDAGFAPCGLGARDTLRLEAGMNLYGTDMDETVSPLECGLGWTVAWQPDGRMFIGREALEKLRGRDDLRRFVGLLLEDRGVLRGHQRVVLDDGREGEITSGGYAPTLERSIALARIPAGGDEHASVEVRGKLLEVRIVEPPFVRKGKIRVAL